MNKKKTQLDGPWTQIDWILETQIDALGEELEVCTLRIERGRN